MTHYSNMVIGNGIVSCSTYCDSQTPELVSFLVLLFEVNILHISDKKKSYTLGKYCDTNGVLRNISKIDLN